MPSWERFEAQDDAYKKSILHLPYESRISLEMASTFGWGKYAKETIGIDTFGASAPAAAVLEHFGFTAALVSEKILALLESIAK
jgi:transketolase